MIVKFWQILIRTLTILRRNQSWRTKTFKHNTSPSVNNNTTTVHSYRNSVGGTRRDPSGRSRKTADCPDCRGTFYTCNSQFSPWLNSADAQVLDANFGPHVTEFWAKCLYGYHECNFCCLYWSSLGLCSTILTVFCGSLPNIFLSTFCSLKKITNALHIKRYFML